MRFFYLRKLTTICQNILMLFMAFSLSYRYNKVEWQQRRTNKMRIVSLDKSEQKQIWWII